LRRAIVERRNTYVGAGAARLGQLGQQRHQNGARPGAEIEDLDRRRPRRAGKAEGAFDQRFGVGARVEARRPDGEGAAVELALGDDPRHGLARQPAVGERIEPPGLVALQRVRSGAAISASCDRPVAFDHQQARVERRACNPRRRQPAAQRWQARAPA
jgi:hypothetical protein